VSRTWKYTAPGRRNITTGRRRSAMLLHPHLGPPEHTSVPADPNGPSHRCQPNERGRRKRTWTTLLAPILRPVSPPGRVRRPPHHGRNDYCRNRDRTRLLAPSPGTVRSSGSSHTIRTGHPHGRLHGTPLDVPRRCLSRVADAVRPARRRRSRRAASRSLVLDAQGGVLPASRSRRGTGSSAQATATTDAEGEFRFAPSPPAT
jgi:hypothetical protein